LEILTILMIIIINFILQSTIFHHIAILGVVPNTALVIIVSLGLLKGEKAGGIAGLLIGFLQDIFFSVAIGANAFVYFFIGYCIGKTEQKVYKESLITPIIFTAISTVAYYLLYYVVMYFLSAKISFGFVFKNRGVVEIIYNGILAIPIYKLFLKMITVPSIKFRR